MTKQRVLFVSPQPFFEARGSSIRVKFNVMALTELGYQVDLLTLPIGNDEPSITARVIRVWNPFNAKTIPIGPSALKLWFDFLLILKGSYLVIRHRYAVLHGTEEAGSICLLLSFLCKAKTIYEKHSDTNSYRNTKNRLKSKLLDGYLWVEKQTIKRTNLTIATGPGLAEQAEDVDNSASVVAIADIPSSTIEPDSTEVAQVRHSMQTRPDQLLVTYVGSFASYQGIDIIFDCIPQVMAKNPAVKFFIIGGNDNEISHYRNQLERQGLKTAGPQAAVFFAGKIPSDELPAYLAASDILLAPRKSGINSPLKILDYFKAGKAIVATNTVANQRLLDHSNAALCEFDAASFADAIIELSVDPRRRLELGNNGHDAYRNRYNFTIFKQELNAAYQALTSGNTPTS